eukprot:SAG31_NODE_566_length_14037_cov_32.372148_2_plen_136_part_00
MAHPPPSLFRHVPIAYCRDRDLLWIAREGLKAPLPGPWKPCRSPEGEVYYFNFDNGKSVWDHPCDSSYREMFRMERSRKLLLVHQVRSYFLVFVPTIREIRDFYREMQRTNRESITMCQHSELRSFQLLAFASLR